MNVSKIRIVQTGGLNVLMFYSLKQFASFVLFVCLGIGTVQAVGYYGFGTNMFSLSGLVGALFGAMPSVFLAREALFEIRGSDCMQGYAAISQCLLYWKFEKQNVAGDGKVEKYVNKLPKLLRWEKSDVSVSIHSGYVSVTGPYGTLISLRKFLSRSVVT